MKWVRIKAIFHTTFQKDQGMFEDVWYSHIYSQREETDLLVFFLHHPLFPVKSNWSFYPTKKQQIWCTPIPGLYLFVFFCTGSRVTVLHHSSLISWTLTFISSFKKKLSIIFITHSIKSLNKHCWGSHSDYF